MRCMTSNGICRGFAFKYGKFPLPLRYRTALSVPKVPTMYSNYNSALHLLARLQRTRSFGRLPYEDLAPKVLIKASFQRTFDPKSSQG